MNRYGLIVGGFGKWAQLMLFQLHSGHFCGILWLTESDSSSPFSESKSRLCTADQRMMMIVNEAITPLLSTWEVLYGTQVYYHLVSQHSTSLLTSYCDILDICEVLKQIQKYQVTT